MIRKPAVAGIFYPSEKKELSVLVDSYLKKAKKSFNLKTVKILIVPHAGVQFSGQTAAHGFKQLENESYKRVILLGVSHHSQFTGVSVWNEDNWETPLGSVAVEKFFLEKNVDPHVHIFEHSLEVQLPFLQRTLSNFKIVPILLGQTNDFFIKDFAKKLSENITDNDLLLVSSDLSHYLDYETAIRVDSETINLILAGRNPTNACGADAIKIALLAAKLKKINTILKLDYSNSGDTGGDKDRVVGYGAIGFY